MTRHVLAALALLTVAGDLAAQQGPSLTLFSSGRTLVRRTVPLTLPAGASTQPLAFGAFDPSSFVVLDPGVTIARLWYDPALSENALLQRQVGEVFRLWNASQRTVITARLVGFAPERWEVTGTDPVSPMRGVVFERPGQILWDAARIPAGPAARAEFTADRARTTVRVLYEAPGGSWSAAYRLFLGANGRFEGNAQIATGSLDVSDAEVQLLAGDIGMKAQPPMPRAQEMYARAAGAAFDAAATNEAVGEARLYTLPGRLSFVPGMMVTSPLFAPAPVRGELRLTIPGAVPFWGGVGQAPDEEEVPVAVSYRFERRQGTPFGDLPLPAGSVSVFDSDRGGRVQLVGQGMIGHTAPGEMLEVSTGTAFDVTARRTQMSYTTTVLTNPRRTQAIMDYQVVIKNAKDTAAQVEVREERGGDWSVVSSSVPPVRRSAMRVAFPVTVPAKGEVTLTYRVRVVW